MKDDYLWDRTGEPDHEIQQLEEVLGTLRYQPRALALPEQVRIEHRRRFFPRIAIAAGLAMMLVGGAFWLLLYSKNAPVGFESSTTIPALEIVTTASNTAVAPAKDEVADSRMVDRTIEKTRNRNDSGKRLLALNKDLRPLADKRTELSAKDRLEAQAAKEQLLLALRVASAKLSLAQKKAQVGYPSNLIRNQHKVG